MTERAEALAGVGAFAALSTDDDCLLVAQEGRGSYCTCRLTLIQRHLRDQQLILM